MMRVLIVEDDPFMQDIVSSILGRHGLTTDGTHDGFAALRMLNKRPYDVALVDYHLPEIDGYTLARLMRNAENGAPSKLRLIGVTADRNGLATRSGAEGLFETIVAKPFDPLELVRIIQTIPVEHTTRIEVGTAAAAFLIKPTPDRALDAAVSFWRARGLSGLPKACVVPAPTAEQARTIQICFDIVDQKLAELFLLIGAKGLQQLMLQRQQGAISALLPVIALEPDLAVFSEAYFDISDPASWSAVANILLGDRASATGW